MKSRLSLYVEPGLAAQLMDLAKRREQSISLVGEAAIASAGSIVSIVASAVLSVI
jgi:hypothetical protein